MSMPRSLWALPTLQVLWLLAACGDPIVGAECRDGFAVCGGQCVDLSRDFRHCGGCGNDCGFFVCDDGVCSTTEVRPDAGIGDGGLPPTDGGGPPDAGRDAGVGDNGISPDAGVSGCGLGEVACGSSCVNTDQDPAHCGGCSQSCNAGDFCAGGTCTPDCDPPLVPCGGACITVDSDPNNCGGCGNVCVSGICVGGQCADAVPGHLVVIGHDYLNSTEVMRRIATNAVFLAPGAPVRVLSYVGGAEATTVRSIRAALDANDQGRTWMEIEGLEPIITSQLADAEVFLIYPQRSSANSVLDKLGDQWGNALAQFMLAGGVVVVFETHGGSNEGTYRILQPPNLFVAASRSSVSSQVLTVLEPGVGLANNLTATYQSASRTSRFVDVSTPGTVVVQDNTETPVVFHRVIRPR